MADRAGSEGAKGSERQFGRGLARAFGGAIFFSLPLLMTMEMWWLGFYMDRFRLTLFMLLMIPMLVGLDRYSGFKETSSWREDAVDGIVAYGVGIVASTLVLLLLNIINSSMPMREVVGKISLQAVAASFGAVLASSQLGGEKAESRAEAEGDGDGDGGASEEEGRKEHAGYVAEIFFMAAGAVFFAFNLAPTEEMMVIAFKMTDWHALALMVVSLLMIHAFVYAVNFHGAPGAPEGTPGWSLFLRYSLVGYAVALLISVYVLWTFGRYDQLGFAAAVEMAVVLGFPASLGAAVGRLVL